MSFQGFTVYSVGEFSWAMGWVSTEGKAGGFCEWTPDLLEACIFSINVAVS